MSIEKQDKTVALSAEDLKNIVETAVSSAVRGVSEELRKPAPPTEAELKRIASEQHDREETARSVREQRDSEERYKHICSHERGNGTSRCVFVHDDLGGYVLCQMCRAVIRPDQHKPLYPADYKGTVMFDTLLFNKCFQKCTQTEVRG